MNSEIKEKNSELGTLQERYKKLLEESKNELHIIEMKNQNKINTLQK